MLKYLKVILEIQKNVATSEDMCISDKIFIQENRSYCNTEKFGNGL